MDQEADDEPEVIPRRRRKRALSKTPMKKKSSGILPAEQDASVAAAEDDMPKTVFVPSNSGILLIVAIALLSIVLSLYFRRGTTSHQEVVKPDAIPHVHIDSEPAATLSADHEGESDADQRLPQRYYSLIDIVNNEGIDTKDFDPSTLPPTLDTFFGIIKEEKRARFERNVTHFLESFSIEMRDLSKELEANLVDIDKYDCNQNVVGLASDARRSFHVQSQRMQEFINDERDAVAVNPRRPLNTVLFTRFLEEGDLEETKIVEELKGFLFDDFEMNKIRRMNSAVRNIMREAVHRATDARALCTLPYCGKCYGAEPIESNGCCNTCDQVIKAYESMGWDTSEIYVTAEQCPKEDEPSQMEPTSDVKTESTPIAVPEPDTSSDETNEVSDESGEVSDEPDEVSDEPDEASDEPDEVSDEPDEVSDETDEVSDETDEVSGEPAAVVGPDEVSSAPDEVSDEPEAVAGPETIPSEPDTDIEPDYNGEVDLDALPGRAVEEIIEDVNGGEASEFDAYADYYSTRIEPELEPYLDPYAFAESEEDEIEEGGEADEEENDKDPYAPLDKEKNQDDLEATKLDSEDLSGKPKEDALSADSIFDKGDDDLDDEVPVASAEAFNLEGEIEVSVFPAALSVIRAPNFTSSTFSDDLSGDDSDTLADNFLNGAKAWARNSVDRAVVAAKHMLGNIGWLFAPAYFEKMRAQQHSERLNMGPGSVFVDGNDTWCSSGNVARITLLMSSPTRAKALVYEHTHLDNQDETTPKILQLTGVALDRDCVQPLGVRLAQGFKLGDDNDAVYSFSMPYISAPAWLHAGFEYARRIKHLGYALDSTAAWFHSATEYAFPTSSKSRCSNHEILLAQLEFKSNGPLVQGTLVNEDISFEVLRIDAFSDSKERTCLSRVRILGSD